MKAKRAPKVPKSGVYKPPKHLRANRTVLAQGAMQRWSWLFVGPVLAAFCIGFVWPFIQGIYLSFCKFTIISNAKFSGFVNYIKAFQDESFRNAFGFTSLFAVVSVVLINVLAFLVAYALTQKIRGANLFRTVFFMPNLIGGIVLGYIWSMIFDGILSYYRTSILMKAEYGFWGLIILILWQQIGYMMIIYIAGLQAVPESMLEAAKIDGAGRWKTVFHVILPNIMPAITICTFLTLTNGFKLFDQNLALTGGEPFRKTEMLALNIANGFSSTATRGAAQAKAVVFFILVASLGIAQLKLTRGKELQQ